MQIRPIVPSVGCEVSGVSISALSAHQIDCLRDALIERKVLVFRDQHISSREFIDFVAHFAEPTVDDLVAHEGHPPELAILHIRPSEKQTINFWHMDYSFRERPAPVLALYARQIPRCGGDTLFANLEAAYDALDEQTKTRIDALHCNHKVEMTQNARKRFTEAEFSAMVNGPPVQHPLVVSHPVSGRKALFVNVPIYCRNIAEMQDAQGDALLKRLYEHVGRPEFHFRLRWSLDTIVIWENTHCLHYPVSDYYPQERLLWRVATRQST